MKLTLTTLTKLRKDGEDGEDGEDGGSGRPSQIPQTPSVKKHLCYSRGTRLWATHGGLDEYELQCWLISRGKANGRANG